MNDTLQNEEKLRKTVLDALTGVAPDVDADSVDPALPFREQFDFDSMDTLNFAIALHEELGVDIAEADMPQLASVDAAVRLVGTKLRELEESKKS